MNIKYFPLAGNSGVTIYHVDKTERIDPYDLRKFLSGFDYTLDDGYYFMPEGLLYSVHVAKPKPFGNTTWWIEESDAPWVLEKKRMKAHE